MVIVGMKSSNFSQGTLFVYGNSHHNFSHSIFFTHRRTAKSIKIRYYGTLSRDPKSRPSVDMSSRCFRYNSIMFFSRKKKYSLPPAHTAEYNNPKYHHNINNNTFLGIMHIVHKDISIHQSRVWMEEMAYLNACQQMAILRCRPFSSHRIRKGK